MTDRYNGLLVVLDHDIREDDAQDIITAIRQLRGVVAVTGHPAQIGDKIAETRVRTELGRRLMDVLYPKED